MEKLGGLVSVRTPFELAVLRSLENPNNYSAQQALKDYRDHRHLLLVSVSFVSSQDFSGRVDASAYPFQTENLRKPEWGGYRFEVLQQHPIEAKKISVRSLYPFGNDMPPAAEILVEFDVRDFAPASTTVNLIAPDGQKVTAEFDLAKLR